MNFHTQVETGNNIQREICSQILRETTHLIIRRLELQYKRPQGEGHSVCEAEGKGQR